MVSGCADVHLFVGRARARSVEVAECRAMNFAHRLVRETYLQHDGGFARNHVVINPISEVVGQKKFVPIRLVRVDNVRARSEAQMRAIIACFVGLYECIEGIVFEFGYGNLLECVYRMRTQSRTSSGVPILNFERERHILSYIAREISIGWGNPRSGTAD